MEIWKQHDWSSTPDDVIHLEDGSALYKGEYIDLFIKPHPLALGPEFFPSAFQSDFAPYHNHIVNYFLQSTAELTVAKLPRGFAKSTVIGFLLTMYMILIYKLKHIAVFGYNLEKASQPVNGLKKGCVTPEFVDFFGNVIGSKWKSGAIHIKSDPWNLDCFVTGRGMTAGVRGTLEDNVRIELALFDDPEKTSDPDSPDILNARLKMIRAGIIPGLANTTSLGWQPRAWYLGTPLYFDALLERVLKLEGTHHITIPAIVNNESIWPKHWTTKFLLDKRNNYFVNGEHYIWFAEYMCDINASATMEFTGGPREFDLNEIQDTYIPCVMTIDAALTAERQSDETGVTVGGYDSGGTLYAIKGIKGKWGPKLLAKRVFNLFTEMKRIGRPVERIGIESTGFPYLKDVLVSAFKENGVDVPSIRRLRHGNKSKTNRISELVPLHVSNKFKIERKIPGLRGCMQRFPSLAGKVDILDAAAYLITFAKTPLPEKSKRVVSMDSRLVKDVIARDFAQEKAKRDMMRRVARVYGKGRGYRGVTACM
jgi:hypothetical protein